MEEIIIINGGVFEISNTKIKEISKRFKIIAIEDPQGGVELTSCDTYEECITWLVRQPQKHNYEFDSYTIEDTLTGKYWEID